VVNKKQDMDTQDILRVVSSRSDILFWVSMFILPPIFLFWMAGSDSNIVNILHFF